MYNNNYGGATSSFNNSEIFLIPCANPDGCENKWRTNAQGIDLNRDFPDFTTEDNINSQEGRTAEVQALMKLQENRMWPRQWLWPNTP